MLLHFFHIWLNTKFGTPFCIRAFCNYNWWYVLPDISAKLAIQNINIVVNTRNK